MSADALLSKEADATRVIVSDDFESGISKSVTRDLYGSKTGFRLNGSAPRLRAYLAVIDPSGRAGVFEHTDHAATGAKSIRIQNSPTVQLGHTPALSWWLYGQEIVRSGQLRIAFDLLIPEEGGNPLALLVRDSTASRSNKKAPWQQYFSLSCTSDSARLGGKRLPVAEGEWVHYALTLPMGVAGGQVKLTVVDSQSGSRSLEAPLASAAAAVNWITFFLPGKTDSHLLLDNLVITVENEAPAPEASAETVAQQPGTTKTAWKATPVAVLDVFPESVARVPGEAQGETVLASTYTPSGSSWAEGLDERWVFHHEMKHRQDEHSSFTLRIGKGGQLYSLRGAFGESIPPQGRGNPWNDEVWQFVAVCSKYNGSLLRAGPVPDAVKAKLKRLPYAQSYFIHNSGAYIPGESSVRNLYCPLLGASAPAGGRRYRTLNWGLVPQVKTVHRSPILYYVQTRDVGNGVIEITYVVHNFSARDDIVFDHLNAPWGGTRVTRLPLRYVSLPDGRLRSHREFPKNLNAVGVRETGGWNLSCASGAPDSPSLALVFGRDRYLETELEKAAKGQPHCQFSGSIYRDWLAVSGFDFRCQDWQTRPDNSFRNYHVAVVIPKFRLAPGTTVWYRSFLVVSRRDRAIEQAKSLVDQVDYGLRIFDPTTTPLVPVFIRKGKVVVGSGPDIPAFEIFAKPVPGSMPLFLIENAATGREAITTDPYIFVTKEKLDLGIPPEHPHHDYYSNAYGYSLDKHNSNWKRLLGYAYVNKPREGSFAQLSELLGPQVFPESDAYHLDLWVKRTP